VKNHVYFGNHPSRKVIVSVYIYGIKAYDKDACFTFKL